MWGVPLSLSLSVIDNLQLCALTPYVQHKQQSHAHLRSYCSCWQSLDWALILMAHLLRPALLGRHRGLAPAKAALWCALKHQHLLLNKHRVGFVKSTFLYMSAWDAQALIMLPLLIPTLGGEFLWNCLLLSFHRIHKICYWQAQNHPNYQVFITTHMFSQHSTVQHVSEWVCRFSACCYSAQIIKHSQPLSLFFILREQTRKMEVELQ